MFWYTHNGTFKYVQVNIDAWKFEDDERYHGEYAMHPIHADDIEMLWKNEVVWIASGDVDVIDCIE